MSKIVNLNDYREKRLTEKTGVVRVPIYSKVCLEGNKLIGEFTDGRKELIKIFEED